MTYSVKDIQNKFGVSQGTVLHWLATHQLRGTNVGRDLGKGKPRWRILDTALEEFEERRSTTPSAPAPAPRRKRAADDVIEFVK